MIVAFTGWRGWTDAPFIHAQIDNVLSYNVLFRERGLPMHIRVTDEDGAANIIRDWVYGLDAAIVTVYATDREREGDSAGPHCCKRMLLGDDPFDPAWNVPADLLVGFPRPDKPYGYKTSLTWNCIGQAHYRGVEVRIPAYRTEKADAAADPLFQLARAER